jgi:hypothetical protein
MLTIVSEVSTVFIFRVQDGSSRFLLNIGQYLQYYMAYESSRSMSNFTAMKTSTLIHIILFYVGMHIYLHVYFFDNCHNVSTSGVLINLTVFKLSQIYSPFQVQSVEP